MNNDCAFCGSLDVVEVMHHEIVTMAHRGQVKVDGYLKYVCHACNSEYMSGSQLDHNRRLYRKEQLK